MYLKKTSTPHRLRKQAADNIVSQKRPLAMSTETGDLNSSVFESNVARNSVARRTRSSVARKKKKFDLTAACNVPPLNTDCMLKIFNYLSMTDLLAVEKVCSEWKDVAELLWRTVTEFDGQWYTPSLKESFKCLNRCGPYVKKIIFPPLFNDTRSVEFLNIVACKCPRVEHVVLDKAKFKRPHLKNFTKILKRLTNLELHDGMYAKEDYKTIFGKVPELQSLTFKTCLRRLNDTILRAFMHLSSTITEINFGVIKYVDSQLFLQVIERCPNLEVLTVNARVNSETIGDEMCKFTKLRHLELLNSGIKFNAMKQLLSLSNLEKLALTGAKGMSDEFLGDLAEALPHLKYLDIHASTDSEFTNVGLKKLAKLHDLEHLDLSYNHEFSDEGLNAVVEANVNLKKLVLIDTSVSEDVFPVILTHCRDLRFLDLSECHDVQFELFLSGFDISTLSKERKPLTVILGGTGVTLGMEEETQQHSVASLNLVLDFDTNNVNYLIQDMISDDDDDFEYFYDDDDDEDDDFDYFDDYDDDDDYSDEFNFDSDDDWFQHHDPVYFSAVGDFLS